MYHERQEWYRCGLHALNNLLQARVFTKETMDETVQKLSELSGASSGASFIWGNVHQAPLGLGNYDVNVLIFVLQEKGLFW